MALTESVISPETLTAVNDAIARIVALKAAIYDKAVNDNAFNDDEGVGSFYRTVSAVSTNIKPMTADEAAQVPAVLVPIIKDEIAPSVIGTAALLEQTWVDIQASVVKGEGGSVVFEAFMKEVEDEDENNAVVKLQNAMNNLMTEASKVVLDTAVTALEKAFS